MLFVMVRIEGISLLYACMELRDENESKALLAMRTLSTDSSQVLSNVKGHKLKHKEIIFYNKKIFVIRIISPLFRIKK